jgi:TRAP-type mannitol/chloroaromatic compound transport system permease large subunit
VAHHAIRPRPTGPDRPPVRPPRVATVVPYLAVLVLVAGGVYISWHQGSHGGGMGGVIAGVAFLTAAGIRLALPKQMAGLLASRNRVTDVVTLVIFGACLLVVGLVLPRLGPVGSAG